MGKALQALFRLPTTKVGIITALMFQLVFSIVWMTGYKGITDNAKNLTIAIVNEDQGLGAKLVEGLSSNVPFRTMKVDSLADAQGKLNGREVQMVLHVAADFSKQLQTPGQKAPIHYYLNESNPQLIKSIMQSVAANVTAMANKQAIAAGAQAMLQQVGPNVPADRAAQMAQGLAERVTSDVQSSNKVDGMHNQMVPMMLVLASFVGAMIMAMNVQTSVDEVSGTHGKWRTFGARIALNVIAALAVGLVATAMVLVMGGQSAVSFFPMWGFVSTVLLAFMFFTQMFLILFGNAGMLLNIIMFSAQLVSSGAIVPRELLGSFYHGLSVYLPATYAVEGNMNLLFGGPSTAGSVAALLWITLACLALGAGGVAVRRVRAAAAVPVAGVSAA